MRTLLAAAVFVLGLPGPSAWGEPLQFFAPVAGTVLTPYWLADNLCIGCNPDGLVRTTLRPLGHDRPLTNARTLMETCDRPFPPGAWDEHAVGDGPAGTTELTAKIYPVIDWDIVICSFRGPSQDEVRADPADTALRWRLDSFGTNIPGEPDFCQGDPIFWYPIGCTDTAHTSVVAGRPYKLVAYNWSDFPDAPARFDWS